jgi:hypothetical protein
MRRESSDNLLADSDASISSPVEGRGDMVRIVGISVLVLSFALGLSTWPGEGQSVANSFEAAVQFLSYLELFEAS